MDALTEIQTRVDALADAMAAKGLREPQARLSIGSHESQFRLYLQWKNAARHGCVVDSQYHFVSGTNPADMLDEAEAFIDALPSAEETRLHDFMGALGRVIDLGRENGIETAYLNPLTETMKRLSENALTHERPSEGSGL